MSHTLGVRPPVPSPKEKTLPSRSRRDGDDDEDEGAAMSTKRKRVRNVCDIVGCGKRHRGDIESVAAAVDHTERPTRSEDELEGNGPRGGDGKGEDVYVDVALQKLAASILGLPNGSSRALLFAWGLGDYIYNETRYSRVWKRGYSMSAVGAAARRKKGPTVFPIRRKKGNDDRESDAGGGGGGGGDDDDDDEDGNCRNSDRNISAASSSSGDSERNGSGQRRSHAHLFAKAVDGWHARLPWRWGSDAVDWASAARVVRRTIATRADAAHDHDTNASKRALTEAVSTLLCGLSRAAGACGAPSAHDVAALAAAVAVVRFGCANGAPLTRATSAKASGEHPAKASGAHTRSKAAEAHTRAEVAEAHTRAKAVVGAPSPPAFERRPERFRAGQLVVVRELLPALAQQRVVVAALDAVDPDDAVEPDAAADAGAVAVAVERAFELRPLWAVYQPAMTAAAAELPPPHFTLTRLEFARRRDAPAGAGEWRLRLPAEPDTATELPAAQCQRLLNHGGAGSDAPSAGSDAPRAGNVGQGSESSEDDGQGVGSKYWPGGFLLALTDTLDLSPAKTQHWVGRTASYTLPPLRTCALALAPAAATVWLERGVGRAAVAAFPSENVRIVSIGDARQQALLAQIVRRRGLLRRWTCAEAVGVPLSTVSAPPPRQHGGVSALVREIRRYRAVALHHLQLEDRRAHGTGATQPSSPPASAVIEAAVLTPPFASAGYVSLTCSDDDDDDDGDDGSSCGSSSSSSGISGDLVRKGACRVGDLSRKGGGRGDKCFDRHEGRIVLDMDCRLEFGSDLLEDIVSPTTPFPSSPWSTASTDSDVSPLLASARGSPTVCLIDLGPLSAASSLLPPLAHPPPPPPPSITAAPAGAGTAYARPYNGFMPLSPLPPAADYQPGSSVCSAPLLLPPPPLQACHYH